MKKYSIILAVLLVLSQDANSQITVIRSPEEEVIASYAMGQQQLVRLILDGDTTYALKLSTKDNVSGTLFELAATDGGRTISSMTVLLGNYDTALLTMQQLFEYDGNEKDIIFLNNPSNNIAIVMRFPIGSWGFFITDEYKIKHQILARDWLGRMIKKLKKNRNGGGRSNKTYTYRS